MKHPLLATSVVALLLTAGCAPESMITSAVPASHSAPSELIPEGAPSAADPSLVEFSDGDRAVVRQAEAEVPALSNGWEAAEIREVAYSDAHLLDAASPTFRAYAEEAMSAPITDGCTVLGISVMSRHPAGFILGSVSTDCGGGQAIWVENDTTEAHPWELKLVLQATPACAELSSMGLPTGAGLVCSDPSGSLTDY